MADYDMIVVGASWGGLMALEKVLGALPRDFPIPIAIAQHRAVDSGSGALSELLAHHSGHDVYEPGDKDPIERGRVYVAPPDYHLLVEAYGFALSTEDAVHFSRPSIDVLFESVANSYGEDALGIILTGASDDGASGLARIRRRGGVTVVQEPASAERRTMPDAALAGGQAHRIVTLEEIAPFIVKVCGSG
jgi:two-component system, chemotaxis family, protein-glutamate methylesterase/glutaminase